MNRPCAYGGKVGYAKQLMHGKQSRTVLDTNSVLFRGLPEQVEVARYHSLAAVEETLPSVLRVTARTADGEIMAIEHKNYPVYGVQFHPEFTSRLVRPNPAILGFIEASIKNAR